MSSQLFTNRLNRSSKKKADPIKVILNEIFDLVKTPPSEEEVNLGKEYIKGSLILESENTEHISQFYGKQRIVGHTIYTIQKFIDLIDKVSSDEILQERRTTSNLENVSKVFKHHKS